MQKKGEKRHFHQDEQLKHIKNINPPEALED